ncbi:orf3 [Panicum miliaceum]|uniref:Orf3 n=1 Tax=Panicum miliaceum TaxID=4540 RepID=A0A3L6Q190_PANMI|nr:orf3 [Panicum miliaceum]
MSHWHQSNVIESLLEDSAAKGFLPPKEVARWRAPPPEHEEPHPEPHEVVSFLAFHERGLGYLAHRFLRGLLHEWRLELQHLNLNGVLHIAGFDNLCEAFLGIEPHILSAKGETSSATPVGGFGLQRRPRHDDVYPEYTPAKSNKGWHGDWFYIRNPPEASFPEFHGGRPMRDLSWTWGTQTPEKTLVAAIKDVIWERVVEAGLNGVTLFFTMRERLVMPLAERRKSLLLYSGPSDPDRAFAEELPEDDVYS